MANLLDATMLMLRAVGNAGLAAATVWPALVVGTAGGIAAASLEAAGRALPFRAG